MGICIMIVTKISLNVRHGLPIQRLQWIDTHISNEWLDNLDEAIISKQRWLAGSDDEEDVRFSADATWSVDATVNLGSTASLRLGVELLLRLTRTLLPCNVPPDDCTQQPADSDRVSRFLTAHQYNWAIQYHSHLFSLENTVQVSNTSDYAVTHQIYTQKHHERNHKLRHYTKQCHKHIRQNWFSSKQIISVDYCQQERFYISLFVITYSVSHQSRKIIRSSPFILFIGLCAG